MHRNDILAAVATLFVSAMAIPAAAPQQPVSNGDYTINVNVTKSGLNLNDLETTIVSYANSSIFIGDVKGQIYSEPFVLSYFEDVEALYFTSYHQVPTGGQNAYIYPNETNPVFFTVPHSGIVPKGAAQDGFGFDGSLELNYKGEKKFIGCQDEELAAIQSWKIYWDGGVKDDKLNCTGPLVIQQNKNGCQTVG